VDSGATGTPPPESVSDAERIAQLERRLARLEWRERATERSRHIAKMLVPDEARQHFRAAWREQLLALRSMADHWARSIGDEETEPQSRREDIPIE
jgi:hypothetical protein